MTTAVMGISPVSGRPTLRVMKNDADDPWTTPSSEVDKFNFDSENRDYVSIRSVTRLLSQNETWNAISNESYVETRKIIWQGTTAVLGSGPGVTLQQEYDGLATMAVASLAQARIVEVVAINRTTGYQLEQGWIKYTTSPARYQSRYWHRVLRDRVFAYAVHTTTGAVVTTDPGYGAASYNRFFYPTMVLVIADLANMRSACDFLIAEWELPARDLPRPQLPASSTTTGQTAILLSPNVNRMAVPGYDVMMATNDQLIFSENKRIVGCIKAGTITLSGTTASVSVPVLPDNSYFVDMQWHIPPGATTVPYYGSSSGSNRVEVRVQNGVLDFVCNVSGAVITYHVYAYGDGATSTTGGSNSTMDGDGFRIWRGPISGPTATNDIIFDSRFFYPRIAGEVNSYNAYNGPTNQQAIVPLPASQNVIIKASLWGFTDSPTQAMGDTGCAFPRFLYGVNADFGAAYRRETTTGSWGAPCVRVVLANAFTNTLLPGYPYPTSSEFYRSGIRIYTLSA